MGQEHVGQEHVMVARRLTLGAAGGAVVVVVGSVLAVHILAAGALPWLLGVFLTAAVLAVVVLGLHAGGHGWFVPLPVLALAAAWAVLVSAGSWASPAAWAIATLALVAALAGALLVLPAIAYRKAAGPPLVSTGTLVGASGTAVTPLAPVGIARVNNESWTVESLSGPLPAGAPVHVARVTGVRLLVWSEAGDVPTAESVDAVRQRDPIKQHKEDA